MKKAKMEQEKEKIVFGLNKNFKKYSEEKEQNWRKISATAKSMTNEERLIGVEWA